MPVYFIPSCSRISVLIHPKKTYPIMYEYLYTICIMRSYGLKYAIVRVSVRQYRGVLKDCRRAISGGYLGLMGGFKTFWGCSGCARAERVRKLGGAFAHHNHRTSGARAVCLP